MLMMRIERCFFLTKRKKIMSSGMVFVCERGEEVEGRVNLQVVILDTG